MPKITSITQQKKQRHRMSLFVDGKFEMGVDGSLVIKYDLKRGDEFTPELKRDLENNDRTEVAYNGLLNFIGYRERCEFEVHEWCYKKQYSDLETELITRLKEKNYLNDERFAALFARDRVKLRGWGPIRLRHELNAKRIDKHITEATIEALSEEVDFQELAQEQLDKKLKHLSKPTLKDKKRLWSFLQRRGFDGASIANALSAIHFEKDLNS